MIGDFQSDGGLFRLDLSVVSNGVKHEIAAKRIFNETGVGVFAIDYAHYKIVIPIERLNTVISIDLNGKKNENIRKNTQKPEFEWVESFALANDFFHWTSGNALLMEQYHETSYYYYQIIFRGFANLDKILFVCVKLRSAQSIPRPFNSPGSVQALLSVDRAKVSWRIPHLLGIQGRGAWQDWTYELEITEEDSDGVTDLHADTKYCSVYGCWL